MAITTFINSIVYFYQSVFGKLREVTINAYGFRVPYTDIIFVCIALYMILAIYWKGAKG